MSNFKKEIIWLKEISKEDEKAFCVFEKRYKKECGNEKIPDSLNPNHLAYEDFLKELEKCKHQETLPEGFVLARYYLIYVDDRIVGGMNLRLGINDFILDDVGHIEYGIAPWERNKGYAKEALKRILLRGLDFGMKDFLLITDVDNIVSQKVIQSCGGIFEKSVENKKFFWMHLEEWQKEESAMAIVFYKNKILSTKELIYGKEIISCPKGHIENKETHVETAIRECFEETNVILTFNNYITEGTPYNIKFMDHHNKPVLKTIYPVYFQIQEEGNFIAKEERILEIKYLEIDDFLLMCSYDNVKEMVKDYIKAKDIKKKK